MRNPAACGTPSTAYASSISYASQGAVRGQTLGHGVAESTQFNPRLQPTTIQAGSLQTQHGARGGVISK
jgi:hypothetical protein